MPRNALSLAPSSVPARSSTTTALDLSAAAYWVARSFQYDVQALTLSLASAFIRFSTRCRSMGSSIVPDVGV